MAETEIVVQVWFITGASRGFGLEIAPRALAGGDAVVATARDPEAVRKALSDAGERLLAAGVDVTDEAQAQAAVAAAVARFDRIDALVNNAGRGLLGAVEEADADEVRAVFDTNVFGMLAVTRAVLPVLRRQRAGRVINISSVGGFAAGTGWGIYAGTKFAVEGISEAMRAELLPLGIHTTVVEPGVFRTDSSTAAPCTTPDGRSRTTPRRRAAPVTGSSRRTTRSPATRSRPPRPSSNWRGPNGPRSGSNWARTVSRGWRPSWRWWPTNSPSGAHCHCPRRTTRTPLKPPERSTLHDRHHRPAAGRRPGSRR
ncbi:SDR family NAD(P)-dependent oxidoreductase [Streptomyces sp. B93]|uniref:SDR family NAD(P)-dependent oxidoreductase n=1 Tax=Streptomyces sp. B93 TaxID=2824875 RepID=UPI0027E59277|nr:SDR family NAD(P)-dependent oxidoreductase [Streptomyces sp. B93]